MVMTIVVLLMVGVVAYFHYLQGIFSAVLSAILVIISAVLAFSYHETVARSVLASKFPDSAHAVALIALFGVIYIVLRVIFDSAVPGNIRVPVAIDKAVSGVAGVVAGCFGVGIFLLAVQSLPFGPSVGGYARYALIDSVDVRVPSRNQSIDSHIYNTLRSSTINEADHTTMLLPVDDFVVNLASHLSDGGSLAGGVRVADVHPSYVDELFFQRLGVQTKARRVAYVVPGGLKQADLKGLYTPTTALPLGDAEIKEMQHAQRWETPLPKQLKADPANVILIVRVSVGREAADSDGNIRLGTGAIRLVSGGKNYLPMGTIDFTNGVAVRATRPDDFIIMPADSSGDFVFELPREVIGAPNDGKNITAPFAIADGVFLEVKRMAQFDLSGKDVTPGVPESAGSGIIRKKALLPAG